ncbi:HlyD family secretion protein [Flavobacterium aquicola]|uniref:Multidrug resistance efflux pump n=1 Tax=Flavobacterium aquicola TaxID=1682742 RepID=A0A3E0EMI1_9FLAO|nr:HlyD family secretion protein [Flavobacterium aquicola]REG99388.1 multidrug resistance efflux pump [Flavobacterium aquicola]
MTKNITTFELRSEEVQEILTRVPSWMIRWGTMAVSAVILLLIFLAWFIKYPDVITAQITITTNIPPEKLIAKTSGRIETILVKNRESVLVNTPLAVIENTANYKDVFRLSQVLSQEEQSFKNFPFSTFKNTQLGDIESYFAVFQKENIANNLNAQLKPFTVESNAQGYEAIQLRERLKLLYSQKSINQNEIVLQKNDLERYEGLFKKGIIATQELEQHKLTYLQVEKNYKNLLSSISSLKSSLNELNKTSKTNEINGSKENVNLERNVIQSFYQLKKAIKDWELTYVLRSSINGKVSFMQLWSANQTVNAGENVFVIIPNNEKGYIGKVKAPALNSGKIRIGQKVNIRIANYPDREFGILKGLVQAISLTPHKDGNLLIDVSLPNALETSYKKQIVFQQEMSGTAEIVTEDLRLTERLLYQFRDIFKR